MAQKSTPARQKSTQKKSRVRISSRPPPRRLAEARSQQPKPKPKRTLPPTSHVKPLAAVVHACCNPFIAPPTKGCFGDGPRNTAVQKRKATYSATLLPTGTSSTEAFIVYNDARDPYIVLKSGSAVTMLNGGRTFSDPSNHTIPIGSAARIVAAEVKLEYVGTSQDLGGVIFHFPSDPDDQTNEAGIFDGTWGSTYNQVELAASHTRTKNSLSFLKPPEHDFRPVCFPVNGSATMDDAAELALWSNGLPDCMSSTSVPNHADVGRFLITGSNPVPVIITICTHIEYYHVGHHAFSTPRVTHQAGTALAGMLSAKMLEPGSNNTIKSPSLASRLMAGADAVLGVSGAASSIVGLLKNPKNLLSLNGLFEVGSAIAGLVI